MIYEFIETCPLCGSTEKKDIYKNDSIHYVICLYCSLVFLYKRPSKEEYKKMYESEFQDKKLKTNTADEAIKRLLKKRSYENRLGDLKFFEPFVNENSRCLEIGGGWGTLSKVIKDKFKCKIKMIEPSETASALARDYYGLDVHRGELEDYLEKEENTRFNFIFTYHVFEHILDPNSFLENIKKILDKDGVLFAAMPDITNPDEPLNRFFHIEHAFYYSPSTIRLMLAKHGFKTINLLKDKKDLKVACQFDSAFQLTSFENRECEKIIKILKSYDRKYKILRFFKKIIYVFLNAEQRKRVSALAANIFKRLGIIKV